MEKLDRAGIWIGLAVATLVAGFAAWNLVRVLLPFGVGRATGAPAPTSVPPFFDAANGTVWIIGNFQAYNTTEQGTAASDLWLASSAVSHFTVLAVAAMAALLAALILRGAPFTKLVTCAVGVAGLVVMAGGIASQLLQGIAQNVLLDAARNFAEVNQATVPEWSISFDPTPIAIGFILALVATAFQLGQRMQHDTHGLV